MITRVKYVLRLFMTWENYVISFFLFFLFSFEKINLPVALLIVNRFVRCTQRLSDSRRPAVGERFIKSPWFTSATRVRFFLFCSRVFCLTLSLMSKRAISLSLFARLNNTCALAATPRGEKTPASWRLMLGMFGAARVFWSLSLSRCRLRLV